MASGPGQGDKDSEAGHTFVVAPAKRDQSADRRGGGQAHHQGKADAPPHRPALFAPPPAPPGTPRPSARAFDSLPGAALE